VKIEHAKVGMRVFEKVFERVDGWLIPTIGRRGTVIQTYRLSVKVRFDSGSLAVFGPQGKSDDCEYISPDMLRHESAEQNLIDARIAAMKKIEVVRRVKVLAHAIDYAKEINWDSLGEAVGYLEQSFAALSMEKKK